MPIQLTQNPYQGINAHFHSFLQSPMGGWTTFHSAYIIYLRDVVNLSLPTGYYAASEKSLQIQLPEDDLPTRPDIAVFRGQSMRSSSIKQTRIPTAEMSISLPDDEDLSAIVIYDGASGRFVTRVEVLSPTNKTVYLKTYRNMRYSMYRLGVNVVDIDYLHETPTIFPNLTPSYPKKSEGAYPYSIAITSPYLEKVSQYCFELEEPIPTLAIPLLGEDSFLLDFGAAYQTTFENDRRAHLLIDYEQLPINFESYLPADQQKIRAAMARIATTKNP